MARKVLFISYFFPPVGGAGVQRAAKFVKYLPRYGWQPVVLTVENPSVPLFDETLLQEIPDTTDVVKARTLEPGYKAKESLSAANISSAGSRSPRVWVKGLIRRVANLLLIPDPQVLWLPFAVRKASRLIASGANGKIEAVIATAPPFSSLMLGAYLARKHSLPLLLDYRDEWDISNAVWENKSAGWLSGRLQAWMQNYALRRSTALLATTERSSRALKEKISSLGLAAQVDCIYNGYDAEDFCADNQARDNAGDRYSLTYVGTLWNLTSIEPVAAAISLLAEQVPNFTERFELVVAGRKTAEQQAILDRLVTLGVSVRMLDYVDHETAINLMLSAQGLCLLLSNMDMARRVVPAKLFEYLAARNTIFAVAPQGEVWDLLKGFPGTFCIDPADVNELARCLREQVERYFSPGFGEQEPDWDTTRFERSAQAGELAGLLDKVADCR